MERVHIILYEIIRGRRHQSVIQLVVNKKLISNIVNQHKKPSIIISTDISNCFDHIAHSITSMAYHHFRLPLPYLFTLFKTIKSMNIFLTTVHGISTSSYSGTKDYPFQRMI